MMNRKFVVISLTLAFLLSFSISAPASAVGVAYYACPDMTGPAGLPDGNVDASDLSAFAAAKSTQSPAGDFNQDGPVNAVDQAMFTLVFGQSDFSCEDFWASLTLGTPACLDLNHDGVIDASDLSAFAAYQPKQLADADFSGDGVVNIVDQTMLELALGSLSNCHIIIDFYPGPQLPLEEAALPPVTDATVETEVTASGAPTDAVIKPVVKRVHSLSNHLPAPTVAPDTTLTVTVEKPVALTVEATDAEPVVDQPVVAQAPAADASFLNIVQKALTFVGQALWSLLMP